MRYYKGKRDSNHLEVKNALELYGWTVAETHMVGDGFPDLVAARSINVLVEVKTKKGKLEKTQEMFFKLWPGPAVVVTSGEDAVKKLKEIEDGFDKRRGIKG